MIMIRYLKVKYYQHCNKMDEWSWALLTNLDSIPPVYSGEFPLLNTLLFSLCEVFLYVHDAP